MLEIKKGKKDVAYLVKDGQVIAELNFKDAKTKKKLRLGLVK